LQLQSIRNCWAEIALCGGIRLTTVISELTDKQLLIGFRGLVKKLMANPALTLH